VHVACASDEEKNGAKKNRHALRVGILVYIIYLLLYKWKIIINLGIYNYLKHVKEIASEY